MRWRANPLTFFGVNYVQCFCIIFHRCRLSVILQLDNGDYPKNVLAVFCPNKQRSSEQFMRSVLVLERQHSFLFQTFFFFSSPSGSPGRLISLSPSLLEETGRRCQLSQCSVNCFSLDMQPHTPSIAFRHLPPNSATFSYATERALFISAQLSTDAVSALRMVWVLIRLWKQTSAQAPT